MEKKTKLILGSVSLVSVLVLASCIDQSASNNTTSDPVKEVINSNVSQDASQEGASKPLKSQAEPQKTQKVYSPEAPLNITFKDNITRNNDAAYIPAQCYTKTQDDLGKVHNPCFSCHTQNIEPNYLFDDFEVQMSYDFPSYAMKNHWHNLFKDRTLAVAQISDESILAYIRKSNYLNDQGQIILAETLNSVPSKWDFNQNNQWDGYTPDIYFNFDNEGYDLNPQGEMTGWRAFAYAPFLGTFWPTNGSTDDVMIRLPKTMWLKENGEVSRETYHLNLSIVLAMIQRRNITIPNTDETLYGVDLNKNGQLDIAKEIVYKWAPTKGENMSYVGKAKQLQASNKLHLAAGLYPEGTEFIHSVRYIDIDNNQKIKMAARIKELRYAKKDSWNTYSQLYTAGMEEVKEADAFPERLRSVSGNSETGLQNGLGWTYQGFIEDQQGALRPQNFEESMTCVGCHSGLSVTTDSSFAFPRKLGEEAHQAGWYHWTQKGLEGIKEPKYQDGTLQYAEYLLQNGSANEFRNNQEVIDKFWDASGQLKTAELKKLEGDISHLLLPSKERALSLNKAYKVIVDEQSYIYGRDPHIEALDKVVWKEIPEDNATGITKPIIRN